MLGAVGLSKLECCEGVELEVENEGIDLFRFKAMTEGVKFVCTLESMQIMSIKRVKQYGRGPVPCVECRERPV